jgi:hypothetical protein
LVGNLKALNGEAPSISESFATGNVSGSNKLGGLVGRADGEISDSYALGDVSGSKSGGLIGYYDNYAGEVDRCFAAGAVSGSTTEFGMYAEKMGAHFTLGHDEDNFWDTTTSGQTDSGPATAVDNIDIVKGYSTTDIKNQSHAIYNDWDFTPGTGKWKWSGADGTVYPSLSWE